MEINFISFLIASHSFEVQFSMKLRKIYYCRLLQWTQYCLSIVVLFYREPVIVMLISPACFCGVIIARMKLWCFISRLLFGALCRLQLSVTKLCSGVSQNAFANFIGVSVIYFHG